MTNPDSLPPVWRSDALQNRDRYKRSVWDDAGSAVHRFALHRIRETIVERVRAHAV